MQYENSRKLLTEREYADLRGCSVRTLQREREDGSGCSFIRFKRQVRYRPQDIVQFIEVHVQGARGDACHQPTEQLPLGYSRS